MTISSPADPDADGVDPQVALDALHRDVLEAIVAGDPLGLVMQRLCHHIAALVPGTVPSVLTVDEQGMLHPVASAGLPAAFSRLVDGIPIGANVGSCGTAAFLKKPVAVIDIATDPRWTAFKDIPLEIGLLACWSSPIFGREDQVVGTFALYFNECRTPSALEEAIIAKSLHLCVLAIEHDAILRLLRETNERFEIALSNMSQGLCLFDGDQKLIVANRRYAELYDLAPDQIRPGMSLLEVVDLRVAAGTGPCMTAEEYVVWRNSMRVPDVPSDTIAETANGRVIAIHHQPMPDSGWVATHEDITERKRMEAQIVYMAHHDALTGLPNRVLFQDRMERALASPEVSCAVLCLDLDRFKAVNDQFGHPVGDTLLQAVAGRLLGCVSDADTVTRVGGDEFAILLAALAHPDDPLNVARRIVAAMEEPLLLDGNSLVISASIGIAVAPEHASSVVGLMKRSDIALSRAKAEAKGRFCLFEPEMEARLQARAALEHDLRRAVRDGGFELFYQPQFTLANERLSGFEALLRWRHPEHGLVMPASFIPLAEETGTIIAIGEWVLRQACQEAMTWPNAATVAVNLSAVQFKSTNLVAMVRDALSHSGLPPARLVLEVTESVLVGNSATTLATLHMLHDLGIRISLDDFGTGYCSLSYLRRFPVDSVKIDQSFVRDLSQSEETLAIVRAVVGLSNSLGIKTTAEGVETEAQLALLRREGCTDVQGFLFGEPVPAPMARLLAGQNSRAAALKTSYG